MDTEPPGLSRVESHRARDAAGTKRAVLDASLRLFTERGFAGTSMRDIALASGVSQPLIHHHFGTKDDLYTAVRHRIVDEYAATFPEIARVTDQPASVGAEVGRIFTFMRANESLLRMLAWLRLEGKHQMFPGDAELRQAMVQRIELAQRLGTIRDDIGAPYVVVMLEGLVLHWLDNRAFNTDLFATPPDDSTYLAHIVALLERGLAQEPSTRSSGSGSGTRQDLESGTGASGR